tara:strand:- start:2268 stop:3911 length:1644 start_codon:yes stop_codon:yes gene_type:complete
MAGYENIPLIREKEADVYAQLGRVTGQLIGQGVAGYMQKQAKLDKEKEQLDLYNQNLWFDIDRNENKDLQKNLTDYRGKKGKMFNDFSNEASSLLNGVGEEGAQDYQMGAKKARFLMKTSKNLSQDLKDKYTKIVNRYDTFMSSSLRTAGSIIGEAKEWDNINVGGDGQKFTFKGQGIDQLRNRMTYFALSGKAAPSGVSYEKDIYAGENGESMVRVVTNYDMESETFLNLPKSYQDKIRNNGGKLVFDQNWEQWADDGLMSEIGQGLDLEKTYENIDFKDKNSKITDQYQVTSRETEISNDKLTQTDYENSLVNVPLMNSKTQVLARAKAKTMISGNVEELSNYIGYTLRQGGQDFKLSGDKKYDIDGDGKADYTIDEMKANNTFENWVTRLTQDSFVENALAPDGYIQSVATEEQAEKINSMNTDDQFNVDGVVAGKTLIWTKKTQGGTRQNKQSKDVNRNTWTTEITNRNDRNLKLFQDADNKKPVESPRGDRRITYSETTGTWTAQVKAGVGGVYVPDAQIKPSKNVNDFDGFLGLRKPKIKN